MTSDDVVEITPEANGVTVVVRTAAPSAGMTGPGCTELEFRASSDGPLMRFLLTGHV